jgi:hypothetical protein
MSHFAKVNPLTKKVENVIVAEQDFINSLDDKSFWLQTSYNTRGGVHLLGGTPLRYNFAAIGYNYDVDADAFYPPKPFASYTLNTTTYLWEAPLTYPTNGLAYRWDEDAYQADNTTGWVEVITND